MSKIKDSFLIVTGAASGMGREIAIQAAQKGATVIGTDINAAELNETAQLVTQKGLNMEIRVFDVGKADEISAFATEMLTKIQDKKLILINNAGIALCAGRFQDTPIEEFERLLDINLYGVVRMTKAFYPYLMSAGAGHIVNLSSSFGFVGIDGQSAYCTSKFGVRGFTETLRMELQDSNIKTTSVHPGGVKTNIMRKSLPVGEFITNEIYTEKVKEFDNIAHTSAEKAATQILNAIEKNQQRLVIGFDGKQLDWLSRLLPTRYTSILVKVLKKKFMNPYRKEN
jgi:short-subunit dehydrogenase